ncbi:MAG: phytoene desaturase [Chromatiaceae bacterium]|nr:phytoene desaturase [Chromatiaceae bacterium]
MPTDRVIVVGAGIGGLTTALRLAARGVQVHLIERADQPGGKMRQNLVANRPIDAGPTVFTMRWVFDELFETIGASLDAHLSLHPVEIIARHAWSADERLDLFADAQRGVEAIGDFAGAAEARRFAAFQVQARQVYTTLEDSFIRAERPSLFGLMTHRGLRGLGDLRLIQPYDSLWQALGKAFRDPRLRQLFARYSTYCGSSPFEAPATLMLIAHVEQQGVWLVEGGMHRLAQVLAERLQALGGRIDYDTEVAEILCRHGRVQGVRLASGEHIEAEAVAVNADPGALAAGLFGAEARRAMPAQPAAKRSLSAITWSLVAETHGFPLVRHNVFFGRDYAREFDDIFNAGRTPREGTVYVCAQDRDDKASAPDGGERLLCLLNAPARGDRHPFDHAEIEQCEHRVFALLERCGLQVRRQPEQTLVTTPATFEQRFPGTGGALYGQATHGWRASFNRPATRTPIQGLYLTGGATHPGAGVPMAALSGRLAAMAILADLAST